MPRVLMLVVALAAAVVLGCRATDPEPPPPTAATASTTQSATAQPTTTVTARSTPTPPPTPACTATLDAAPFRAHLPFDRIPGAALDYLNAGGNVGSLRTALTCWGNIRIATPADERVYGGIEEADLDADGTAELVLAVGDRDRLIVPPPGRVLILQRSGSTYTVRFDSTDLRIGSSGLKALDDSPLLLPFEDRNGDGAVDLTYTTQHLYASSTGLAVTVIGRRAGTSAFETLLSEEMTFGRLAISLGRDGTSVFTLTGGPKSGNYGPPRDRRETYAWNGQLFAKVSDVPAEPRDKWDDLWVVYDADRAARSGRYDEAIEGYRYLEQRPPSMGSATRAAELRVYGRFRLMLAYLATGDVAAAQTIAPTFASDTARRAAPGSALALGAAFMTTYDTGHDLAAACVNAIGNDQAFQSVVPSSPGWPEDLRALMRLIYFDYRPKDFCPFG